MHSMCVYVNVIMIFRSKLIWVDQKTHLAIYLYFFIHLRTWGNWLIIQQSPGFYFESPLAANQLALVFPVYPFPYEQASQVTPTAWTIKCTWFYLIICRITTGKTSSFEVSTTVKALICCPFLSEIKATSVSFRKISTVYWKLNEAVMMDLQEKKNNSETNWEGGRKVLRSRNTMNGLQTIQ